MLKRDGFSCRKCPLSTDLNVHHIDGWALFPKKRYWVKNGITLCARCHYIFHEIYMGGAQKSSKKADFEDFMKNFSIMKKFKIDNNIFQHYVKIK